MVVDSLGCTEMLDIKKPLIIAGHGIRLADAIDIFYKLLDELNVPVVTTFNGFDIVPSDHSNFVGRIGTLGTFEGNKVLKEADFVICLGTRNNIRQVSYEWEKFAPNADIILVDIDPDELLKPTRVSNFHIVRDMKEFIQEWLDDLSV